MKVEVKGESTVPLEALKAGETFHYPGNLDRVYMRTDRPVGDDRSCVCLQTGYLSWEVADTHVVRINLKCVEDK